MKSKFYVFVSVLFMGATTQAIAQGPIPIPSEIMCECMVVDDAEFYGWSPGKAEVCSDTNTAHDACIQNNWYVTASIPIGTSSAGCGDIEEGHEVTSVNGWVGCIDWNGAHCNWGNQPYHIGVGSGNLRVGYNWASVEKLDDLKNIGYCRGVQAPPPPPGP